jgi:hypothetical protein
VDTGFFIDPDRHIYGLSGRTQWWVRPVGGVEVIEGRKGATGFHISDRRLLTARGVDTGFHLVESGRRRQFHGPGPLLPWMPQPEGMLRPPKSS